MKVIFSFQKNDSPKFQKQNVVFGAGLTPKMVQEIKNADVLEISEKLAEKGLLTDFKENKIIAWCCQKTVGIFEQLNKNFRLKLALPKGIYAEDFEKLNIDSESAFGFCNMTPTFLKKNSTEITPAGILFFNTFKTFINQVPNQAKWFYDWRYINKIADKNFVDKFSSTDHFLIPFFHEFSHVLHENNMIKKIGSEATIKGIVEAKKLDKMPEYIRKYGQKVSQICEGAKEDPLEAIAFDLPRIIADCLDKETLMPTKNPFIGTPYENLSFWQRVNIPNYSDEERPLNEILRRFWNGKFE